jgi:H+-translocating NAD(P) transhydrogenase subunit alpha
MYAIGVARETARGETRVAMIPQEAETFAKQGYQVLVEVGAGVAAGYPDEDYVARGARVVGRTEALGADVVLQVRTPGASGADVTELVGELSPGSVVIGLGEPLGNPKAAMQLAERGVTSFALEMLPRITRAQGMDVLSSQAAIAGYKAVLVGAVQLNKILPMLSTAAGTLPPARVLVVGAGVAGLSAIATARRLGGVVHAYDVRRESREQVQSVGAAFVELPLDSSAAEGTGGYAAAMSDDFYRRQQELLASVVAASDIVITTAQVPGKPAPKLLSAEMIAGMAAGSVVVDVAAAAGGNCELSLPDEPVTVGGVHIVAPTNLPATVPTHASRLLAKNYGNFLRHILGPQGLALDHDDPIVTGTLITRDGTVVHPAVRELLGMATDDGAEGR